MHACIWSVFWIVLNSTTSFRARYATCVYIRYVSSVPSCPSSDKPRTRTEKYACFGDRKNIKKKKNRERVSVTVSAVYPVSRIESRRVPSSLRGGTVCSERTVLGKKRKQNHTLTGLSMAALADVSVSTDARPHRMTGPSHWTRRGREGSRDRKTRKNVVTVTWGGCLFPRSGLFNYVFFFFFFLFDNRFIRVLFLAEHADTFGRRRVARAYCYATPRRHRSPQPPPTKAQRSRCVALATDFSRRRRRRRRRRIDVVHYYLQVRPDVRRSRSRRTFLGAETPWKRTRSTQSFGPSVGKKIKPETVASWARDNVCSVKKTWDRLFYRRWFWTFPPPLNSGDSFWFVAYFLPAR